MSASKEYYGGWAGSGTTSWARGGNAREWRDVGPGVRRCPVCGSPSWCQVRGDGAVVLCKRVASDREKENADGVTYYVHWLSGAPPRTEAWERRLDPSRARADVETLDTAFAAVLRELRLSAEDRAHLRARGLSDATIDAERFRSLGIEGRARVARAVEEAVGDDVARIPGIVQKTEGARAWWSLSGSPGIVIPCRDTEGRVVALKVRRREAGEGPRYLYLTSSRAGGASALSALHVPLAARDRLHRALVITEGELKACVAQEIMGGGFAVVSLPGVGAWRAAVELVAEANPRRAVVAFDMDRFTNPVVARACRDLVNELRARWNHERVELWSWDRAHKGIDDYLASKRKGAAA